MNKELHPVVQEHYDNYLKLCSERNLSISEISDLRCLEHNITIYNHESPEYLVCSCCGIPTEARYCEPIRSDMIEHKLCFTCHFWKDLEPKLNDMYIYNGNVFVDGGSKGPNYRDILGHGGREFELVKDGNITISNNVWHRGSLPWNFKEKYPDNCTMEGHVRPRTGGVL